MEKKTQIRYTTHEFVADVSEPVPMKEPVPIEEPIKEEVEVPIKKNVYDPTDEELLKDIWDLLKRMG